MPERVIEQTLGEIWDQEAAVNILSSTGESIGDEAYQREPLRWLVDVLGIPEHTLRWSMNPGYAEHRWDGTPDPLIAILGALAKGEDVGAESGTGTGKTYLAGGIVLWFNACFRNSIVVTATPKEKQLELHLWKEIGRLWPRFQTRFPGAELSRLRIRMRPGTPDADAWGAVGFAVGVDAAEISATKAQGFHAEHLLIITEETPGIKSAVMTAFENTCTAPHNLRLALGNPDHQQDELHKFCTSLGVRHVRISEHDHPNVVARNPSIVPGAISLPKVEARATKYGIDSMLYLSRVRGISPAESSDALIKLSWIREAIARSGELGMREGAPALGVDVANSENGDRAALARWQGKTLLEVQSFACPDANLLGLRVATEMRALGVSARAVGVDSVGVGAGTVNELKRLGHQVRALNGGATVPSRAGQEELFLNLRSAMWWQLRLDLQHGTIALPDDEELVADLVTPTWEPRGGKIVVESKETIKGRLGRSPDKGDACAYGNYVRQHKGGMSLAVWQTITGSLDHDERDSTARMLREMESEDFRPRSTTEVLRGRY